MKRLTSLVTSAVAFGVAVGTSFASDEAPEPVAPPPPSVVAFDPAAMPEPAAPNAPLGYRYASLSASQAKHLRRGFKLPMEALASGGSLSTIRRSIVLGPLPNPGQPFLAVAPTAGDSNPFTGSRVTSFREDPMRAFGELLGVAEGDASVVESAGGDDPFGGGASDDPFAGSADGGFADAAPEVSDAPAETSDPFEDAADPFGGDASDDPFADF